MVGSARLCLSLLCVCVGLDGCVLVVEAHSRSVYNNLEHHKNEGTKMSGSVSQRLLLTRKSPLLAGSTSTTRMMVGAAAASQQYPSWWQSYRGGTPTTPATTTTTGQQCRWMGGGPRGARGHGWYVNYRAGKGGRHLQGDYHDRESLQDCQEWNAAILALGHTTVYMDVVLEPRNLEYTAERLEQQDQALEVDRKSGHVAFVPPLETLTGPKTRLTMHLATTVMPESTHNFLQLCQLPKYGYKGTKFYRFEKLVGLCGGDVLSNTGKTGLAAPYDYPPEQANHFLRQTAEPLRRTIFSDPLALWHIPGTVTMLVQRVHEVDSRFILCTQQGQHLDGIHRAIGQLTPESLQHVQEWQEQLAMKDAGIPISYELFVTDCGVVEPTDHVSTNDKDHNDDKDNKADQTASQAA